MEEGESFGVTKTAQLLLTLNKNKEALEQLPEGAKGKEINFFSILQEGKQPYWHLVFSTGRTILDFCPT